jgi:hypothetical protein
MSKEVTLKDIQNYQKLKKDLLGKLLKKAKDLRSRADSRGKEIIDKEITALEEINVSESINSEKDKFLDYCRRF